MDNVTNIPRKQRWDNWVIILPLAAVIFRLYGLSLRRGCSWTGPDIASLPAENKLFSNDEDNEEIAKNSKINLPFEVLEYF